MLERSSLRVDIPKNIIKKAKIAIIKSEFNPSLTQNLENECLAVLLANGIKRRQIFLYAVPGSLEIPLMAQKIAKKRLADIIIALGVIIKGDTYHFELVANECARGCIAVSLKYNIPIIFEVLATYSLAQAKKRAIGSSNKGREAAISALKMLKAIESI